MQLGLQVMVTRHGTEEGKCWQELWSCKIHVQALSYVRDIGQFGTSHDVRLGWAN